MLRAECLIGLLGFAAGSCSQRKGDVAWSGSKSPFHHWDLGKPAIAFKYDLLLKTEMCSYSHQLHVCSSTLLLLGCILGTAVLEACLHCCKGNGAGGEIWTANGSMIQQMLLWGLCPTFFSGRTICFPPPYGLLIAWWSVLAFVSRLVFWIHNWYFGYNINIQPALLLRPEERWSYTTDRDRDSRILSEILWKKDVGFEFLSPFLLWIKSPLANS